MPKRIVALTDTEIRKAKAKEKNYKLYDGGGLFLLVTPTGGKLWRLKYSFGGTEKLLALGIYPEISLSDARQRRDDAKKLLANGTDPGEVKKLQKTAQFSDAENSFEMVSRKWHAINTLRWSPTHAKTTLERLTREVFPNIGSKPVNKITLSDLKAILHRIEDKAPESARRVYMILCMVLRYCVVTELIERSPLEGLKPRDLMTKDPIKKNFPAITNPIELAPLLRIIDDFKGSYQVKCALQLAPLLFQRPGDLRCMEWADIDLEAGEWNIPIPKMKLPQKEKIRRKDETHCVPLSVQAVDILKRLQPFSGHSKYCFPSYRTPLKTITDATLTAALHRMGYQNEQSLHGFRATARTLLDEVLGFPPDHIEHQLAHAVRDSLGRAYNRTSHLPARRAMMQQWADYLDGLKVGAKVIPLKRAA